MAWLGPYMAQSWLTSSFEPSRGSTSWGVNHLTSHCPVCPVDAKMYEEDYGTVPSDPEAELLYNCQATVSHHFQFRFCILTLVQLVPLRTYHLK
jgi:hypothetical protein